jgi:hypothetical protein
MWFEQTDIFGRAWGEKSIPVVRRNKVWNRVGHAHKMGIKFSSPADSCQFSSLQFPHIYSIDASKNQFHNEVDFSQLLSVYSRRT